MFEKAPTPANINEPLTDQETEQEAEVIDQLSECFRSVQDLRLKMEKLRVDIESMPKEWHDTAYEKLQDLREEQGLLMEEMKELSSVLIKGKAI